MIRFLSCIMLLLVQVSTVQSENARDQLKGVKQEIKVKKQLISKTRKVEAVVSTELVKINQSLEQKKADLGKLDRDLRGVESSLDRTGEDIQRTTEEANRKKQEITGRLVSLYKAGEFGVLRMFFSAESFPSMAENIRYMRSIVENDKIIFAEYNQKLEELRRLKTDLERDAVKKERIKQGIALKKQEIENEKNKKANYLAKVRQDRTGYEKSLKELQANASRLQSMLNRLEALSRQKQVTRQVKPGSKYKPGLELPPVPDRGFSSQKGRMSLPVKGEVIETFGKHKHPEFNSYTYSKGLSISAANGTQVKSIYEGNVIFADYFKGYGNMIIVDHGGGYFSLYAHASRLLKKVGSEVAKNEVVAMVGDSDSTKGSHLYFEIRHKGSPVDPAGWVR